VTGLPFDRYLPDVEHGFAFSTGVTGSFAGSSGNETRFTGNNETLVGFMNNRAISNVIYDADDGLYVDGLRGEHDLQDWRYTGGLFETAGNRFVSNETIYGLGVGTTFDRRLDLAASTGTEIITLDARAVLGGRLRAGNEEAVLVGGDEDGEGGCPGGANRVRLAIYLPEAERGLDPRELNPAALRPADLTGSL